MKRLKANVRRAKCDLLQARHRLKKLRMERNALDTLLDEPPAEAERILGSIERRQAKNKRGE